jgi:hypothetical protein
MFLICLHTIFMEAGLELAGHTHIHMHLHTHLHSESFFYFTLSFVLVLLDKVREVGPHVS